MFSVLPHPKHPTPHSKYFPVAHNFYDIYGIAFYDVHYWLFA